MFPYIITHLFYWELSGKKKQPTGMIHVNMYLNLNFCFIFLLQWPQGKQMKNNQF